MAAEGELPRSYVAWREQQERGKERFIRVQQLSVSALVTRCAVLRGQGRAQGRGRGDRARAQRTGPARDRAAAATRSDLAREDEEVLLPRRRELQGGVPEGEGHFSSGSLRRVVLQVP